MSVERQLGKSAVESGPWWEYLIEMDDEKQEIVATVVTKVK